MFLREFIQRAWKASRARQFLRKSRTRGVKPERLHPSYHLPAELFPSSEFLLLQRGVLVPLLLPHREEHGERQHDTHE